MPLQGYQHPPYILIRDKKSVTTAGGTFTQGAWRTRDLNEILHNAEGLASLSSNQITLPAGTYRCAISAPGYRVEHHQARLYDISNTALLILGTPERVVTNDFAQTRSFIHGQITLTAVTILEVQHYCTDTYAGFGFGNPADITDEIYTIAEFWRIHG